MKKTESLADVGALAGAIGLIYDRTALSGDSMCGAWLIGDRKVATVASPLVPFMENLKALKVSFPKGDRECGVVSMHFHPAFDYNFVQQSLIQGMLADAPEAVLQKFNCAVLTLSDDLSILSQQDVQNVSTALRASVPKSEPGLVGSLKEIELPLVLQTIKNAGQAGILYLFDDLTRPIAQMFYQEGKLAGARYKNLLNELAIYQIIEKRIGGKFSFTAVPNMTLPSVAITSSADAVLIEAHRRLDELEQFKTQLGGASSYFVRAQPHLPLEIFESDMGQEAGTTWRVLDGMTPADQLWLLIGLDDYTVFRVLFELHRRQLIRKVQEGGTRLIRVAPVKEPTAKAKWSPLSLGLTMPLHPFDELTSIGFDVDAALNNVNASAGLGAMPKGAGYAFAQRVIVAPKSADAGSGAITETATNPAAFKSRVKTGALLGAIDAYDTWHLLHEIPLLPSACGVPIFKDGLVIGMHCGVIPSSPDIDNPTGLLQQMLWVDVVMQCLKASGDVELVRKLTELDMAPPDLAAYAQAQAQSSVAEVADRVSGDSAGRALVSGAASSGANGASKSGANGASASGASVATPSGASAVAPSNARGAVLVTSTESSLPDAAQLALPGCNQIASLKCPKCGETTFGSARVCEKCHFSFVPVVQRFPKPETASKNALLLGSVLLAIACCVALVSWTSLPKPILETPQLVVESNSELAPGQAAVKLAMVKANPNATPLRWVEPTSNSDLKNGDLIRFRVSVLKPSYLYLVYKGRWSDDLTVIYPAVGDSSNLMKKGGVFNSEGFQVAPPRGRETVLAIASDTTLDSIRDESYLQALFNLSMQSLARKQSKDDGVLLTVSRFSDDAEHNSNAKTLYVTSVTADHQ